MYPRRDTDASRGSTAYGYRKLSTGPGIPASLVAWVQPNMVVARIAYTHYYYERGK